MKICLCEWSGLLPLLFMRTDDLTGCQPLIRGDNRSHVCAWGTQTGHSRTHRQQSEGTTFWSMEGTASPGGHVPGHRSLISIFILGAFVAFSMLARASKPSVISWWDQRYYSRQTWVAPFLTYNHLFLVDDHKVIIISNVAAGFWFK